MKLASRILLVFAVLLFVAPAAYALTDAEVKQQVDINKAANPGTSGAGIGMGLAIVGAGIGLGLIGFSALSGIARQPEQAGKIQGVMYVLAALVEGAAIIALLLCFLVAARIMG
jgi:F-type H+-transporting ATPase subunit c